MKLYKNYRPAVSIILPTFNRSGLLSNAIRSVINQSYKNWELLVIDDGSKDDTFNVINNFLVKSEKIRYIKHTNRGVALSMNAGLKIASGKYVTFLGSDDCYKEVHLEKRINFMEENPNIDLIHGGVVINGNPYVQDKNDISKQIHLSECIIGGTIFAKAGAIPSIGGFHDIPYSAESDLYERAVENGLNVERVEFPTYVYNRDTPDSITNSVSKD